MEIFCASLASVRGIHRSPVNFPHKGQWRGALMFSLICAWINRWVNNREAGDLRRDRYCNGIASESKWSPFWRQQFQVQFAGLSVLSFKFDWSLLLGFHLTMHNGLVSDWRQAIIWNIDGPVHWLIRQSGSMNGHTNCHDILRDPVGHFEWLHPFHNGHWYGVLIPTGRWKITCSTFSDSSVLSTQQDRC